jgi:hypothetical protein
MEIIVDHTVDYLQMTFMKIAYNHSLDKGKISSNLVHTMMHTTL